jgi:lipopolysaccharide transport system permease protein
MVIELNPMTPVIEGFRALLLGMSMDWSSLIYGGGCALLVLLAGVLLFQRTERSFADIV